MNATMKFSYGGRTLPARVTMGTLRRFKAETGNDMVELQRTHKVSADDLAVLLWCAIVTQCRVEGMPFDVSLDDFLDRVTPDEVARWHTGALDQDETPDDSKKKTTRKNGSELTN